MKSNLKLMVFSVGMVFGLAYLSLALEGFYRPSTSERAFRKSASAAPVETLSEIRVRKQPRPNFDDDLHRLSTMEKGYASGERMPGRLARTRLQQRSRTTYRLAEKQQQQRRTERSQQAGRRALAPARR